MNLFDPSIQRLQTAIIRTGQSMAVVSKNIANASTPGYAPQFIDELDRARKVRHGLESRKMSLERNMNSLSQLTLHHSACTKLLTSKLGILKTVVAVGKR